MIEDAAALRRTLVLGLRARGFDVVEAADGESGLERCVQDQPDLIVLDLGLPGIGGLEVLRRLRTYSHVPVLVLSARDRRNDKVDALDAGADDYVTKPFDAAELLARIRAALRRGRSPASGPSNSVVRVGDVQIDLAQRQVLRNDTPIRLTRTELALLVELASNPGKLLTRDHLLRRVWGEGSTENSHYLRVYVAGLRRKLGDDAADPRMILTEPGVGYRWIGNSDGG